MIPYAAEIIGFLIVSGLASIAWYVRGMVGRLDNIEKLLSDEVSALRTADAKLDKEIELLKQRCALEYRRHDDPPGSPKPIRWHSSD